MNRIFNNSVKHFWKCAYEKMSLLDILLYTVSYRTATEDGELIGQWNKKGKCHSKNYMHSQWVQYFKKIAKDTNLIMTESDFDDSLDIFI